MSSGVLSAIHSLGRVRTALPILLLAGAAAMAASVDKRLEDLDLRERQQLYTYGVMSSLAYRGGASPALTEAEQTFLRRTGYVCLGAREAWGIRVLGFYNQDQHRLVIATRGTNLRDRASMILNLVSDLGIGRHLTDEEILTSLEGTLQRQREEPGHLAPHGPADGQSPAIQATARELAAAAEVLMTTARTVVPQRVKGETFYQRTLNSASSATRHAFNLLWGATYGAASQAATSAKYGMAAGAGAGGVAAGVLGNPVAGALGGGLVGGVAGGIAGGATGLVQGGYQAMKDQATDISINLLTSGDGYYQTLSGLKVVDGFARDFIGMVNGTAPGSVPVTVVYAGHSLGGYLSTVIGALRGGRAYSFNGPGVTAEKIRALAQDLQLPQLPALGGDFAEGASRNITTTVLSSDLIGNLGAHEGTLITVRNGDSPFGRNREAMRWLMHELHAKVDTRVGKQPPAATDAAAFNHLGAPELGLDPAATYRKTFHAVALEQHSIKHLVRLLESLEPMAGLVHVHALPLPSPFAAEAPGAGSRAQEAVEDAYHSASRGHRLQAASDQALPFAGDELADETTPEQTR